MRAQNQISTQCALPLNGCCWSDRNQWVLGNHHSKKNISDPCPSCDRKHPCCPKLSLHGRCRKQGRRNKTPGTVQRRSKSWHRGLSSSHLQSERAWRHPSPVMPRGSMPQLRQAAAYSSELCPCFLDGATEAHLFNNVHKSPFSVLQGGHLWTYRQGGSALLSGVL